jgi:molecular chaperone GrpE
MSSTPDPTPGGPPEDPLDEALEETFPASDPVPLYDWGETPPRPGEAPPTSSASDREADELAQTRERLLRTAAELQNVRRRSAQDRERAVRATRRDVLGPVLDVYDDVLRALETARAGDLAEACAPVLHGVELIAESFRSALARLGVERMEVAGQPFDAHLHEAVLRQPATDEVPPGHVLTEVRPGYRLGGEVLRHARVVVATEPDP